MKLSEEESGENWPAIRQAMGALDPDTENLARKSYFGGKVGFGPPFVGRDKLGISNKLLLVQDIDNNIIETLSVCRDWTYGNANQKRKAINVAKKILSISCDCRYTFHTNTLYNGREGDLLDALGFFSRLRLTEITEQGTKEWNPNRLHSHLRLPEAISSYLVQCCPAKHNIAWRLVSIWAARLRSIPDGIRLSNYQCDDWLAIEWACRNPLLLDDRVVSLAEHIRSVLTSDQIPKEIRDHYQFLTDESYGDYLRKNHLAEKITVAVQYDNKNQVRTSVDLLDPNTRYPISGASTEAAIKCLLPHRDGDYRLSRYIIECLWKYGQEFSGHLIPDDRTLIFYPAANAKFETKGYEVLAYDTAGIHSKYVSKRIRDDDANWGDAEMFAHCVVIGENSETYKVGLFSGQVSSGGTKRILLTSNSKLKCFAGSCATPEELAIKFCSADGYNILRNELENTDEVV